MLGRLAIGGAWGGDGCCVWEAMFSAKGMEFWGMEVGGCAGRGWYGGWDWMFMWRKIAQTASCRGMFLYWELSHITSGFPRQDQAALAKQPSHVIPWWLIDSVSFTTPCCCMSSSKAFCQRPSTSLGIALTQSRADCDVRRKQRTATLGLMGHGCEDTPSRPTTPW